MPDLVDIMEALRPNNGWKVSDDILEWDDDISLKPTDEEIESKKIELTNSYPLNILRYERDIILIESDKYSLPDWPHSSDTKRQEWLTYRQALRDLPSNQTPQLDSDGNLTNEIWPTEPS